MNLRLLKIVMQPVFVLDDGTSLTERVGQAFTVPASDVSGFPEKWAADFAALQQQVAGQGDDDVHPA